MKLIMENWRHYVAEVESEDRYGYLYLFEGDSVKKVSFHQRLKSLNESEGDFEIFLEEWEESAAYQLDRLDEVALGDAYLATMNQAWLLLNHDLPKAWKNVLNVTGKLRKGIEQKRQENPKLAKALDITVDGLAAAALVGSLVYMQQQGIEPGDGLSQIASEVAAASPDVGANVAAVAENPSPEALEQLIIDQKEAVEQVTKLDAVPEIPQTISDEARGLWEDDPFGDLMAEFEAEDAARATGGEAAYGPGEMENLYKQMTPEERETLDIFGDMLDQKMQEDPDLRKAVEQSMGQHTSPAEAKGRIAQKLAQLGQKAGEHAPGVTKRTRQMKRAAQVLFTPEKFAEREKEAAFEVFKDLIAQKEAAGR